jgi:hypothetical protein
MGVTCSCSNNINTVKVTEMYMTEQDIQYTPYNSSYDSYFNSFEDKYNILRYMSFSEFSIIFTKFKFSPVTTTQKTKENIFYEEVEKGQFLQFFENKIISHPFLSAIRESEKVTIFKDYIMKLFDLVSKGNLSALKRKNADGNTKGLNKKLKKTLLLALGFLFCTSSNNKKLELLFNVFKDEENKIDKSKQYENMDNFLFVLFLIASYGTFKVMDDLRTLYKEKIPQIPIDISGKTLEVFEIGDIFKMKENFLNKLFFQNKEIHSLEIFKEIIKNEELSYFLNGNGIRHFLEHKNEN